MRKFFLPFLCCVASLIFLASCSGLDTETPTTGFDKTNLYGKWQETASSTLHYIYYSDGTGKTWDTADDVTEDEAQNFTWSLSEDYFLHIYLGEMGAEIPKEYTMKVLTSSSMTYSDNYGKSWTFRKI